MPRAAPPACIVWMCTAPSLSFPAKSCHLDIIRLHVDIIRVHVNFWKVDILRERERVFVIDNLQVRIHLVIEMSFSRPALRHWNLNSFFKVALYLPPCEILTL